MRIVGGKWRGRALEAPEGRDVTRPTTDRTREQMASMALSEFGLDLSRVAVLDAFAGSGAIGLEMLSRGAASCTFIDADRKAAARVRRNAESLGASRSTWVVLAGDATRLVARGALPHAPFSLVVLDPPYAMPAAEVSVLVEALAQTGQLAEGAVVIYERDARHEGLAVRGGTTERSRSHGTIAVDLVVMGGTDG